MDTNGEKRMMTSNRTMYILLEKGSEDAQLISEINRLISQAGVSSIKEVAERYPLLLAIKQGLAE